MARKGLRNAFLENDLDAAGHRILNLAGVAQGGVTYVDATEPDDENGEPGTGQPFKTLFAALAATPAGYNIVIRPGDYEWDGFLEVTKAVKIFGYGAVVSPATSHHAGLHVTADEVQIHGMAFDGGFTSGLSDDGASGCIALNGSDILLRDIRIDHQHNTGIELRLGCSDVRILTCRILNCFQAIGGRAATTVEIVRNGFGLNREGAIILGGDNNVTVARLIQIALNVFVSNNLAGQNAPTIAFTAGGQDISIIGNQISDSYDGINLTKTLRASIEDNVIMGCTNNSINIIGHLRLKISGNLLDGTNPTTGVVLAANGIVVSGNYSVSNDSGASSITDNDIFHVRAAGCPIKVANVSSMKISGNKFLSTVGGSVLVQAYQNVEVTDNRWTLVANDAPIILDAAGRASAHASIRSNHFEVGAPTRLISITDLAGDGQDDIHVIANTSTAGKTYSSGAVGIAGTAPTNLFRKGNSPVATGGPTTGWVNDDDPVAQNQVFVSQLRGNNTSGLRESKARAFLTINAAIAAAVSGDTVYVLDGVFDELMQAKDGLTVRFMPEATLVCVTANGCLSSSATAETFHLYHEHAPIKSSKAGGINILLTHAGNYYIHADIVNTGTNTGTVAHGVRSGDAALIYINGSVFSAHGNTFDAPGSLGPAITVQPAFGRYNSQIAGIPHLWADAGFGAIVTKGSLDVSDMLIYGGGAHAASISTAVGAARFTRCKFLATGTAASALDIVATSATKTPILIDCILQSEATATGSITTSGAQTVRIMGSVMANKGADPPTNITFTGGGEYTVNAGAAAEFIP